MHYFGPFNQQNVPKFDSSVTKPINPNPGINVDQEFPLARIKINA